MDVEPSGLTTVGLPGPAGRGGGEHAGDDEAELLLPLPVPVPAPLEAAGAGDEADAAEESAAGDEAEGVTDDDEDAVTVPGDIRIASAIVSATGVSL